MNKPTVFIGSSSEGLEIAQAIQYQLQNDAIVKIWNEGIFNLSHGILESLINSLDNYDFAILILRGDDKVLSKGTTYNATRDNVLLELGLFLGHIGRSRTFMVFDKNNSPAIISDLSGITFATYDSNSNDLITSVGPACFLIRKKIKDLGKKKPSINKNNFISMLNKQIEMPRDNQHCENQEPKNSNQFPNPFLTRFFNRLKDAEQLNVGDTDKSNSS